MDLDLNEFLQDICLFRNHLKEKDDKIEDLQKKLLFAHKENEILQNSRSSLFHEVSELNSAVASLRNSFKKIEVFESDRKTFLEENQKLKTDLETLEKLYQDERKNSEQELEKIKEENMKDTEKLICQIKNEASKGVEILKLELVQKENDVEDLKKQITKLLNERNQDVLKTKIQYEDKIRKLKQQIPKSKMQTSHGVQMNDIFRQKYLKLEKESQEEISKLKEDMQSLRLMESLKPKSGCTPLSTVLLAANKQNVKVTTEVSMQTENHFTGLPWQFKVTQNDDDFEVKKKSFSKTRSVLPQKRKLFNLNENYYIK